MKLKDYCIKEGKEYLLDEWDVEKNLPFTLENVAAGSAIPVWWTCEKGHSWQTQVRSRAKSLTRCPKCLEAELRKKRKEKAKEYAKRLQSK